MPIHKKSKIPPLSMIYRRIAISFVVLTVLLVGIIVFFSLAKATVVVIPKEEIKSAEFLVTAKAEPSEAPGVILGQYKEQTVEVEGAFEASGTTEKPGRAEGMITVVNTTNAPQPLVATTRFLSPEGALFRTVERLVVPANGSVEARVRADEPGAHGDIGPTRFTIPGLNPAKQALIYGESKSAMVGGAQNVRAVTAEDLERARSFSVEKAVAQAKEEFSKTPASAVGEVAVESEEVEVKFDAKAGEHRQSFTLSAKVKVRILSYDKDALEKIAREKVQQNIPQDREIVRFNKDAMIVRIKNVNAKTGEIQLSVYADAAVRLSAASPILDTIKIAGMLPEEAARYLKSFDAIEDVEVRLFPSWQKRIPTIPDRIKIVIKKQ